MNTATGHTETQGGKPAQVSTEQLSTHPVTLAAFWNADIVRPTPEHLLVNGGTPLIYNGHSHALLGEPGRGKSLIAHHLIVEEAKAGRHSLFLDFEKSHEDFKFRMTALGATEDDATRLGYWRLTGALDQAALTEVHAYLRQHEANIVVIDAVGRALSRHGYDENNNHDVQRWYDQTIDPLERAGYTVVMIDHLRKPDNGNTRSSRYAKGAGAKLAVITGAAYLVETGRVFSARQSGHATVVTAKDNIGERYENETAAIFTVTPADNGSRITVTVKAPPNPDDTTAAATRFRPTALMAKASSHLASRGDRLTRTELAEAVGGRRQYTLKAIDLLVIEGFITIVPATAPKRGDLLTHTKPFIDSTSPF